MTNPQGTKPLPPPAVIELRSASAEAVMTFFDDLDTGDRTFLKQDSVSLQTVLSWQQEDTIVRCVTQDESGRIGGFAAVIPGTGWSRHVGHVMVAVRPDLRAHGLGSSLAREVVRRGYQQGLSKLIVEVNADHTAVIQLFTGMGFAPEALLEDHVLDGAGHPSDLIILSQRGEDNAALFAAVGLSEDLT